MWGTVCAKNWILNFILSFYNKFYIISNKTSHLKIGHVNSNTMLYISIFGKNLKYNSVKKIDLRTTNKNHYYTIMLIIKLYKMCFSQIRIICSFHVFSWMSWMKICLYKKGGFCWIGEYICRGLDSTRALSCFHSIRPQTATIPPPSPTFTTTVTFTQWTEKQHRRTRLLSMCLYVCVCV